MPTRKMLTRRLLRWLYALAICLSAFLPSHAWAATYVVSDLADSATDPGSLRYAVNSAQNGDTITFAPGVTGTITLASTLTLANAVTIQGPGAGTLAISGGNAVTVLAISSATGTVALSGLTIENGGASDLNSGGDGGGVSISGVASLTNCVFSGNSDFDGGGVYNSGTATLIGCTFSGNSAVKFGGGFDNAGTAALTSCTFTNNVVTGASNLAEDQAYGGAFDNDGGTAALTGCTLVDNGQMPSPSGGSTLGGGLANTDGDVTLTNCTLIGNTAQSGGALYNGVISQDNGGIRSAERPANSFAAGTATGAGTAVLTNCTITANDAAYDGGGGIANGGTVTLTNDIVYDDSNGEVNSLSATANASYCDIGEALGSGGDGVTDNGGNIDANPLFVMPDTGSMTAFDLHLAMDLVALFRRWGYDYPFLPPLRRQRRHQVRYQSLRHAPLPVYGLQQDLHTHPQEPGHDPGAGGTDPARSARAYLSARHRPHPQGRSPDSARRAKKRAMRLTEQPLPPLTAPVGDVIEFDELCLRQSPPLWLWVGVSRQTRQVLASALGERTDEMLAQAWAQVPSAWRDRPIYTDHWGAYARLLPKEQHHPCDKGTGLTSIVESLNTKWRQRQSGLVRRSCGVHTKISDDLAERFGLLVDEHNRQSVRR